MRRPSSLILSIVGSVVLFLASTAGILGVQGRLGTLFGAKSADGAASKPADGEHDAKNEEGAKSGEKKEGEGAKGDDTAKKGEGADKVKKGADSKGEAVPQAAGLAPVEQAETKQPKTAKADSEKHDSSAKEEKQHSAAPAAREADREGAKENKENKESKENKEAVAGKTPKRGATSALVQRFQLPAPASVEELTSIVSSLKESRESYERMKERLTVSLESAERDRLDVDARSAELESTRRRLDAEKADVQGKVAEMSKRMRELEAGESRYVASTVKRLKDLTPEDVKTALLREDDYFAAQVLNQLPARLSGQVMLQLPAERYGAISKALRAVAATEAKQSNAK